VRVDRDVFLGDGFSAIGGGPGGAVRLTFAQIEGYLDLSNGSLLNTSGPALTAHRLRVGGGLLLRGGFEASGVGEGAVRLSSAQINGDLDCSAGTFRNDSGPAFVADRMKVDGDVVLAYEFRSISNHDDGVVVDLSRAHTGGVLVLDPDGLTNTSGPTLITMDGLTYSGIPLGTSLARWLVLLRDNTPGYASQAYQQLAGAYRAAGYDSDVRKILTAQRRHQIRSKVLTGRLERTWARLSGPILGYGYQTWRIAVYLLAVVVAAVILSIQVGRIGGLAHTMASPSPGEQCSLIEQIGVGLDLGLPLFKTGARTECDVTGAAAGKFLVVAGWTLQLMAWAFGTWFAVVFTGIVRKS
jgi:hypothetical protein